MEALPSFRGGIFRAWLLTIAQHAIADTYRRAHPSEPLDVAERMVDPAPAPDEIALLADERRLLQTALSLLSHDERRVIELRLSGLRSTEVPSFWNEVPNRCGKYSFVPPSVCKRFSESVSHRRGRTMPNAGELSLDLRLDRYFDEILFGDSSVSGLNAQEPALAATVRRLSDLNAPKAAHPQFASRLWNDLIQDRQPVADPRSLGASVAEPAESRLRLRALPPVKIPGERRRWMIAQFATAALLVVTLIAGWLAFDSGIHNGSNVSRNSVPMIHGNSARTGEQPGPGPKSKPQQLWSFNTLFYVFDSPVIANNTAYIGNTQGVLFAINIKTGKERWRAKPGAAIVGAAAVADGMVFAQTSDGLFAVDAKTGAERWHYKTEPGPDSTPVVVNGIVYLASGNAGSPAVVDGVVYVGGDANSSLYGVNARTGEELWRTKSSGLGLSALDAATGAERWHFATTVMVRSGPAIDRGVAYFGTADGSLHALDIKTRTERWTFAVGGDLRSSPVIVDGVIYIGGDQGMLYSLNATNGVERWHSAIGSVDEASPAVVNGIVYAGGNNEFHALDADSGQELWNLWISFSAVNSVPRTSQPDQGAVVVGGVLYLTDGMAVLAFSDKDVTTSCRLKKLVC